MSQQWFGGGGRSCPHWYLQGDLSGLVRAGRGVSPALLRCLGVVLELSRGGRPLTLREVARPLGWQPGGALIVLRKLRELGLVAFEDHQYRTLRPAVTFTPV